MKGWAIRSGIYSVLGGGLLVLFGVTPWRAVVITACGFAVLLPMRVWPSGWYGAWPARTKRMYGGGTHQVAILANRIALHNSRGSNADSALQYRLRTLAAGKLSRLDITWEDPRAAQLLGEAAHTALRSSDFRPNLSTLDQIITAIENIDQGVRR